MSFRIRVFIIAMVTVGTVLTVVMMLSWSRIMQVEMAYLDNRLCLETKRVAPNGLNFPNSSTLGSNSLDLNRLGRPDQTSFMARGENIITQDLIHKLRVRKGDQLLVLVQGLETDFTSFEETFIQTDNTINRRFIEGLDWSKTHKDSQVAPQSQSQNSCQFASFEYQETLWRGSLYSLSNAQSFIAVDIAASHYDLQNAIRSSLIFIVPLACLFSALGAWLIASMAIRPLNRLRNSMKTITQKKLGHRLSEQGADKEFKVLIQAYNTMLIRLDKSFQQASRFTADAAHELKTPLTILRGRLEQGINQEDSCQVDLNSLLDDVGTLSAITRKLLLLSQADSGTIVLHRTSINLSSLLNERVNDLELALDESVLECDISPEIMVLGDQVLLSQLLNNLFSNVIRYGLPQGRIQVSTRQLEGQVEVLIRNHCLAVSKAERAHLFERFFRAESARHNNIEGSGLGLSLAQEIAYAHGGDIVLEDTEETVMSLRLILPVAT